MAQPTPATTEEELLVRRENQVVTLTLNRPGVLNALTHGMMRGLLAELKKAQNDPSVRIVVLTGAGRAFCAGADLGDLKDGYKEGTVPSLGKELETYFNPLIRQIRRMEKPVIGVVNGLAAGAGASLVLACDIKLCSATAKFISAFVSVGLAPDSGFTHMLAHTLGLSLSLEHAWTAKPIPARKAEHFGLVNAVVPSDELPRTLRELTDKLLKAPPLAVALTKRSFNRAMDKNFEDSLDYETHLQEALGRTSDHLEGVTAFLEHRAPDFKGE